MTARRLAFVLAIAAASLATPRVTSAQAPFASLIGVVDDSLRSGPLVGALVTVVGTKRQGTTDLHGVFRIDSIPPGPHEIVVTHPLMDTLGVQVVSQTFSLEAGVQHTMYAHTPSFDETRAQSCPRGGVATGTSILLGRVTKADTDEPVAGATVSLVYKDGTGKESVEKVRSSHSGANGMFAICGLPSTISGNLQGSFGGVVTADLPLTLKDEQLATASLTIGGTGAGRAILKGIVMSKAGPVAGAQVTVVGTTTVVLSADDGSFTLTGLPSGTHEVIARKIGFARSSQVIPLSAREPAKLTIVLDQAQVLATVKVTGKMELGLDKIGFTTRKKGAMGWYITPEQIEAKHPDQITDLFRTANGVRVSTQRNGRTLSATRSSGSSTDGCINFFIDHARFTQMQAGDVDDAVRPEELGAVEYYADAMETPPEFNVPGQSCATMIFWTKTLLMSLDAQKPAVTPKP